MNLTPNKNIFVKLNIMIYGKYVKNKQVILLNYFFVIISLLLV